MILDKSCFFNKSLSYVVVGATLDKSKSGFSVFKFMKDKGFKVIPINPHYSSILNNICYPDLVSVIDEGISVDVVIFVVKPSISKNLIESYLDLGLSLFWFQPGSEFNDADEFCLENNILCVCDGSCFMLNYNNYL